MIFLNQSDRQRKTPRFNLTKKHCKESEEFRLLDFATQVLSNAVDQLSKDG